jgi:hypothetical protein
MASLIEELISVLKDEEEEYKKILKIAEEKTPVIIKGDITKLQEITAKEQIHGEKLTALEKRRQVVIGDIGLVLNKPVEELTIKNLISLLEGQEKEQRELSIIHDGLKKVLGDVTFINELNKNFIDQSLEMVEFNLNMYKSMYASPETANYNKNADNNLGSVGYGVFDAKQ